MKKKDTNFWRTLLKYTRSNRKNLVLAVIFSVINGIAVALAPLVIKYVIDDAIQNDALPPDMRLKKAAIYCIAYLVICASRILSWAVGYHNLLVAIEGFMFRIRSDFFRHIQTLCMRFFDKTSSGELFNYIMGSPIANLKNFLSQFAMSVPYQSVALVISLCAMMSYDWLLTLVMFGIVVVSAAFNHFSRKRIRRLSGDLLKSESEASKYIDDMLHGSSAIKMYAIEDNIHANFEKYIDTLKNKGVSLSFTQWKESAKPEFTQYFGTALIYIVGAYSCIYRGLTAGELVAFVTSMSVIINSINLWFNVNLIRSNAESGLDRIMAILNIKTTTPEDVAHFHDINLERESARRKNIPCLEFRNVSFGYDNRQIFKNLNCKMEYNHSFGLVGSSGSGKSTVTKLIMRLYEIDGGEILMHGRNIKEYSLHDLRKNIGIVPQDPFIFQASIIENIRMACPEAPMLEVIQAMETARVHEFVNDLPKGWNTVVGDNGFNLSGGQKQRIAIARAILGKPDILIFDEATSALDNVSEKHIQHAMEDLMKTHTVIMIAHRLTTVKNVDKIFVFDKGEIVQTGSYDELSKQDGLFKDLLTVSQE
ncbi:MAG: ABC transporter ATP-binding protein [Clostridiales bacterium]|nr:ABC transporter ATP-binding protein [Clostridiales bacterium]